MFFKVFFSAPLLLLHLYCIQFIRHFPIHTFTLNFPVPLSRPMPNDANEHNKWELPNLGLNLHLLISA